MSPTGFVLSALIQYVSVMRKINHLIQYGCETLYNNVMNIQSYFFIRLHTIIKYFVRYEIKMRNYFMQSTMGDFIS